VPGLQDLDRVGESDVPDILADFGAGLAGAGSWFDQMTQRATPKIAAPPRSSESPAGPNGSNKKLLMF
jgi:hypothetical protein